MPKKGKKKTRAKEIDFGTLNKMVDVIREEGEINVEKLAFMFGTTAYQIAKAWKAMGDDFRDIRVTPDGTFYVTKEWRKISKEEAEYQQMLSEELKKEKEETTEEIP
jgi:predicted peroxiredoxin